MGSIQKKDPNKRNTKGATMSSMAKKNGSKQPIPNSFGTDDFFNNNSGNNDNNDFDPFGLENNNTASNNITDLYNQKNNGMFNGNNSNFGYQGKSNISAYVNDPFAGIGTASRGPQPAKYVPRKKKNDPFAQFGSMK